MLYYVQDNHLYAEIIKSNIYKLNATICLGYCLVARLTT